MGKRGVPGNHKLAHISPSPLHVGNMRLRKGKRGRRGRGYLNLVSMFAEQGWVLLPYKPQEPRKLHYLPVAAITDEPLVWGLKQKEWHHLSPGSRKSQMQGVSRTIFLLEALSGVGAGKLPLAFDQVLEATCIPGLNSLAPSFYQVLILFLPSLPVFLPHFLLPPSTFSLPLSPSIFFYISLCSVYLASQTLGPDTQ